jgi:hypothetical protein
VDGEHNLSLPRRSGLWLQHAPHHQVYYTSTTPDFGKTSVSSEIWVWPKSLNFGGICTPKICCDLARIQGSPKSWLNATEILLKTTEITDSSGNPHGLACPGGHTLPMLSFPWFGS